MRRSNGSTRRSQPAPVPPPPADATPGTWHDEIRTFKRTLLERRLAAHDGNRTRTARSLGLQRTYLLRLLHELELGAPLGDPGRAAGLPR